jgi:hypothetical protein
VGDYARVGCEYVTLEDWDDLRKMVAEHGTQLLPVALMPTATTSHHGIRGAGDGAIF